MTAKLPMLPMAAQADRLSAVPEPSEDEVTAAIYAYRASDWGQISPDFDLLPVFARCQIQDDMRAALLAAAMVRTLQAQGGAAHG